MNYMKLVDDLIESSMERQSLFHQEYRQTLAKAD